MAKLRKSSMKNQCYEVIKEKILMQEYDLGEFINIVTLSNELSVSNTPIREALSLLEADGLVTSALNTKVRVIDFDEHSFREMTQTVNILLSGAYSLCVKEDKLQLLIYLMKEQLAKQLECLDAKEYFLFIHESIAFDKCILDALGNTRMLSVFNSLSNVLFLMVRINHQKNAEQRNSNIKEHKMILEAIENNQHDNVIALLEQHYNKTFDL